MIYHGTSELYLNEILESGIVPRKHSNISNWDHSVASNPEVVYLTIAYPLYFANNATTPPHRLLVLEIDDTLLDPDLFCPDEDALEQITRGHDGELSKLSMVDRTAHYITRMHEFNRGVSLDALGNCAYSDVIPAECITRIAAVDHKTYYRMVMAGYDPSITIQNFQVIGEKYKLATKWLFDPDSVQQQYIDLSDDIRYPLLPIIDDRVGIKIITL